MYANLTIREAVALLKRLPICSECMQPLVGSFGHRVHCSKYDVFEENDSEPKRFGVRTFEAKDVDVEKEPVDGN